MQATSEINKTPQSLNKPGKWKRIIPILFYLALVALGLTWMLLGNKWYGNIIPFYDSLAYQSAAEKILLEYQARGWGSLPRGFITSPTAVLYMIVIALLSPVLPLVRTVLYVYFIPIHLIALAALFNYLRRKTDSITLALLGPLLYISTVPFRTLWGGVLDQRMDLSTASFGLLLWVVTLDWAENSITYKKSILFGLVAGLALLHRPMISVQASLTIIMLVGYAVSIAWRKGHLPSTLRGLGLAAFIVTLIFIPWFVTHFSYFYNYYVVNTTIVGASSFSVTISAYLTYFKDWAGAETLYLLGIILATALVLRSFSWKYFLLTAGLVFLPLVPLIVSGSNSSIVSEISLAGIGFIPLIFITERPSGTRALMAFTLVAIILSAWNLTVLSKSVNEVSSTDRGILEETILKLNDKLAINTATYFSGFISVGGGADAITSVARLDMGIPLYSGAVAFHTYQFGLDPKKTDFSEAELDRAAACGLQKAYSVGGILMLVEPSLVGEYKLERPFANSIASRMDRLALEDGYLTDTGVVAVLEGVPVRFYLIAPEIPVTTNYCKPQ
ncbi:MAG: hypothetical protein HY864_11455 [Chloroflexi bacterium]|nr:hypothetical protein [Chloroflexota bacterium]